MLIKKTNPKADAKSCKTNKVPNPTDFADHATIANSATTSSKTYTPLTGNKGENSLSKKSCCTTRIIIKCDAGYGNQLYIRGKGANLSWEKGQCLKNLKADEWQWETQANFSDCEFKILLNDREYEKGHNHHLQCGATLFYSPHFS